MPAIKPKKSLGQNFLVDKNISKKITNSLKSEPTDTIIEIGPGVGALTQELLSLPSRLAAIEIDERACSDLEQKFPTAIFPNFTLIHKDFMDFDIGGFIEDNNIRGRIKIIGNLPYYISSRILYKVIENAGYIEKAVFMVQKEVAERLTSCPGNKAFGILTVAVNYSGTIKRLFDVSPQCFFPKPKVTSTVFELDFKKEVDTSIFNSYMEIVKAAFNQRRKMLRNALGEYYQNRFNCKIDVLVEKSGGKALEYLSRRAEELSWKDYYYLWGLMNQ